MSAVSTQIDPDIASRDSMTVPEGFKLSELGLIPLDWQIRSLRSCLRYSPRYGLNAAAVEFDDCLPTYLRITDISDEGRFAPSPRVSVLHPNARAYFLNVGNLVFARTGASVGKSYLYNPSDGPLVFAGFLIQITPDPETLDSVYLAYYVQSKRYWNWVAMMSTRSGQPGINGQEYGTLQLPIPSIEEQRAIAAALSDADGLIGALDALIEKKRAIKQAAMQQLLTGKKRLPGFSGEWETKRLGDVASIRNQKILPSNADPDTLCVELEHIGQGNGQLMAISTAQYSTSSKYRFFTGDVLFGRLRSYLRKFWHADRDGICTTEIWPLMVDASLADSGFLYAIVQSDRFVEAASISYGTHMPRADWNVMKNFEVCLPPLPEQTAIAAVLSDMDAEIAALERRREKTKQIKQGMMQQLLTGRIRLLSVDEANEQ